MSHAKLGVSVSLAIDPPLCYSLSYRIGVQRKPSKFLQESNMLKDSCHCGAIQLSVAQKPQYLNQCHCSICYKYGTRWGYYTRNEVETQRKDEDEAIYQCSDKILDFCRCSHCGCVYAWLPIDTKVDEVGVNMRMFDEADMEGVEVRDDPGP